MGKHGLCLDLGNNAQYGEGSQTISEMHCRGILVSQELNNELMLGSTVPYSLRRLALAALSDARKSCLYCTLSGENGRDFDLLFLALIENIL